MRATSSGNADSIGNGALPVGTRGGGTSEVVVTSVVAASPVSAGVAVTALLPSGLISTGAAANAEVFGVGVLAVGFLVGDAAGVSRGEKPVGTDAVGLEPARGMD